MDELQIKRALYALADVDDDITKSLDVIGLPSPRIRPAGFETLLNTIVSQQISTKAAETIWGRVSRLMPNINAESLLTLSNKVLREAGLSQRKMEYAQGLATSIVDGNFDPSALIAMSDDEAIMAITQLRGFGRWSAEIYLMFSLQRQDIFPADDLILLSSLQKLKTLTERPTPKQARQLIQHWSPWLSAGSLFLWHYHNQNQPHRG
jgi:DNA-3-methyladenine glycosylase II